MGASQSSQSTINEKPLTLLGVNDTYNNPVNLDLKLKSISKDLKSKSKEHKLRPSPYGETKQTKPKQPTKMLEIEQIEQPTKMLEIEKNPQITMNQET